MTEPVRQLPRGRHNLSREEVAASQRDRMLMAMALTVGEQGYVKTSVAAVIKRARVSRETFYEHFADKQDCFLAAHDTGVQVLLTAMGTAAVGGEADGPTDAVARVDRMLQQYFAALAAHPEIARTFLVEVYAAGPEALAKRAAVQEQFVATTAAMVDARDDRERFACRAFVAAISSLVTTKVSLGEFDGLDELRPPLLELIARVLDRS